MARTLQKLLFDFLGLARVCGVSVALKWLLSVVTSLGDVIRRGNLQAADRMVGEGPFTIKLKQYGAIFKIVGEGAVSGIREMYVRDTYLWNGLLRIKDGDTVVDLGANMGNFTNLALSCGKTARVIAVEPSSAMNAAFRKSVAMNAGYGERVILIRGFLGQSSDKQNSLISQDANYCNVPWITEAQLIKDGHLTHVDFLKCDIEGGEFELLTGESKLLAMTRSIAIEIHAFAGDVKEFIERLKFCGFAIVAAKYDPDGSATVLGKRL
jgi:FkbM family methyltransferase